MTVCTGGGLPAGYGFSSRPYPPSWNLGLPRGGACSTLGGFRPRGVGQSQGGGSFWCGLIGCGGWALPNLGRGFKVRTTYPSFFFAFCGRLRLPPKQGKREGTRSYPVNPRPILGGPLRAGSEYPFLRIKESESRPLFCGG